LHNFFLGFCKLHVEVWFFFDFLNFVWVLTIFFDPYNLIVYCLHKTSIEGGLVQIWTLSQQLHNHTF
jgi:hypothetical protein